MSLSLSSMRGGLLSSSLFSSSSLSRRLYDGERFGPKLAQDGGRIFQSSSRDVENIIKKKGLSPQQVEGESLLSINFARSHPNLTSALFRASAIYSDLH